MFSSITKFWLKLRIAQKTLLLVCLVFTAMQIAWLLVDQRMLVVERHFLAAAQIAHEWRHDNVGAQYPEHGSLSPYPPFLAYWSAPGLALFGVNGDVAALTLIPFAWLLLWGVWKTTRMFMPDLPAAATAALTLAFHHTMVMEPNYPAYPFMKEYLLDLPLSAFTAASLYMMLRLFDNSSLRHELGLGLTAGLGALTKVSFPLYLLILFAAAHIGVTSPRPSWRRWRLPLIIAAAIALPWYLLHAPDLFRAIVSRELNAGWAEECGMPHILSISGIAYAARIAQRLMSLPLALIAAAALIFAVIRKPKAWKFVLAGVLISQFSILFIWGKSERLTAPVIMFPAMALGLAALMPKRRSVQNAIAALWIIAAFGRMFLMNGFVPPALLRAFPETVKAEIAPSKNDWAVREIIGEIEKQRDSSVLLKATVVPFLGHFRHASFQQMAGSRGLRMAQESEWLIRSPAWRSELEASEFIVTKTGSQGPARFAPNADAIAAWIMERENSSVRIIAEHTLPDGSIAALWHHERERPTWERITEIKPANFLASFDNGIKLLGYEIKRKPDSLELRFQWWCESTPSQDARLFIQAREGYRNLTKQSYTPGAGLLPTALWKSTAGLDETYVLPLPENCRSGDHDVWIGWHRRGKRVPARDSIFPLFVKALCIGKTAPSRQGALAGPDPDTGLATPLKLPPLPGR